MEADDRLYSELAAAYVRGCLPGLDPALGQDAVLVNGRSAGLKLHRFKRTTELPRVRGVLGVLRSFDPSTLLDVGSGRGVFLWPLLDSFPSLAVTSVEPDPHRAAHIDAVRRGGVARLSLVAADASRLSFPNGAFDVVTALEVLEHQADPLPLAREAVRIARRAVVASVPSKPDDNPEHLHLFTRDSLSQLLRAAGATAVRIDYVLNHMIAVARVDRQ